MTSLRLSGNARPEGGEAMAEGQGPARAAVGSFGALGAMAVGLLALKLALMLSAAVTQDEAYYFLWALHPGLSYYDHPPLNAWALAVSSSLFGWTTFAVRAPVILSSIATVWVLYLWAKRRGGDGWQAQFWISVILYGSMPVILAATSAALPDHLLVLFGLASAHFFLAFFEDYEAGAADYRLLYLGAAALGFAGLAKYNAGFLGIGVALLILLSARLRPLLVSPHLYLAAGLSLAMQAPVLIWNLGTGLASFHFILAGRHGLLTATPIFGAIGPVLLTTLFVLSPFALPALFRLLFGPDAGPARRLGVIVFLLSSAVTFTLSLYTFVLFHWNLVAYLILLPLAAGWIGRRLAIAQAAYGAVALLAGIVNFAALPLTALMGVPDRFSAHSYGWTEVAAAVEAAEAQTGAAFLAGAAYPLAAQLAFALRNPEVTSLYPSIDEFDFWFDPAAHRGRSAIIVADGFHPLGRGIVSRFETVTELTPVEIGRFGIRINEIRIYFGTGFR
ncbi:MAG: glycosyltransferase family 39 protein [Cucumibacter sp.]